MELQLSKYQSDILRAVQQRCELSSGESIKGLLIEALAGTGKSFAGNLLAIRCQQKRNWAYSLLAMWQ